MQMWRTLTTLPPTCHPQNPLSSPNTQHTCNYQSPLTTFLQHTHKQWNYSKHAHTWPFTHCINRDCLHFLDTKTAEFFKTPSYTTQRHPSLCIHTRNFVTHEKGIFGPSCLCHMNTTLSIYEFDLISREECGGRGMGRPTCAGAST